jgi:hypothetical protein
VVIEKVKFKSNWFLEVMLVNLILVKNTTKIFVLCEAVIMSVCFEVFIM